MSLSTNHWWDTFNANVYGADSWKAGFLSAFWLVWE